MRDRAEADWDHPSHLQVHTGLDPDFFDWLAVWCEQNAGRIERQLTTARAANEHELRRLHFESCDIRDEVEELERRLAEKNKERRRVKRQIVVRDDAEPLVSDNSLSLDKVYLFCRIMACSRLDFYDTQYPFVKNERQLVLIYHQMISAMRVLYRDFVEERQQADKKLKPRKPNPNKWKILQNNFSDTNRKLEEQYVSSEKDARMACTALQTVLYLWQQELLPEY
ncbi:hypothetical protein EJ03DRAFT_33899 [Teratosphaeria nubilosa]|uniref:Uncharacterized protein n=1 Tax=Teratosphaeria nubilosa TaxID=161662 RepID=A0A6G1KVH8_9PEZI|nr:hypothetical protein EJ03DRAFT_33899 [Teratosphaeria nubilosa]